jgi:hypothetical protein
MRISVQTSNPSFESEWPLYQSATNPSNPAKKPNHQAQPSSPTTKPNHNVILSVAKHLLFLFSVHSAPPRFTFFFEST